MKISEMIKALICMNHWKKRMKKLASKPAYTKEWWDEIQNSIEFVPEDDRAALVRTFVEMAIQS